MLNVLVYMCYTFPCGEVLNVLVYMCYTLLCAYITAIKDKDLDPAPLDFGDEPAKRPDKVNYGRSRASQREKDTAALKNKRIRRIIRNRVNRFVPFLSGK